MNSYDFILTRLSDSKEYHLTALRGAQGEPRVEMGMASSEVVATGQAGVIRIETLRGGTGQRIMQDPERCWHSDGWNLTHPERVVAEPYVPTGVTIGADGIVGTHATAAGPLDTDGRSTLAISKYKLFENVAGAWTEKYNLSTPTFSFSWTQFGENTFFGRTDTGNVIVRDSAGVYSPGSWEAKYVISAGIRLFRVRQATGPYTAYVSWSTDGVTFSTEYPIEGKAVGVAAISPHILIAVERNTQVDIVTMDTDGVFTTVLTVPTVSSFITYGSGALLLTGGSPRIYQFEDALNVRILDLSEGLERILIGPVTTLASPGTTSLGPQIAAAYDSIFALVKGFYSDEVYVVRAVLDSEGIRVMDVFSTFPNSSRSIRINELIDIPGFYVEETYVEDGYVKSRVTYIDSAKSVWVTGSNSALKTSIYVGDTWTTKQFKSIKGYVHVDSFDNFTFSVHVYVDEAFVTAVPVTSSGLFQAKLPASAVGRNIYLAIAAHSTFLQYQYVALYFPLEVDYYYLPEQEEVIRIPVVLGATFTRGGVRERRSRKDMMVELEALVRSPSRCTLAWSDGRSDWTVEPVDLATAEVYDTSSREGGGAVATLALRRVD